MALDHVLSLREAAEKLKVSPKTVKRLIESGELIGRALDGSEKHPGTYIVDGASVQAYLERNPTGRRLAGRPKSQAHK